MGGAGASVLRRGTRHQRVSRRRRATTRTVATRADDGDLSRSVSRRARPEDPQRAARPARAGPRLARRRAAGVRLVLRVGGDLQSHRARDGGATAASQGSSRLLHRRGRRRDRESRVHSADPAGAARGWLGGGGAASGRDPGPGLRAMSAPDATPREHKATAPKTAGCFVLTVSDTKTPETDTSGTLI